MARHKPITAVDRFADLKSDYAAMLPNRFRRTRPFLWGSGDAHYYNTFQFNQTREYARDMDRNDAVIGPMINRAVENTLQMGFRPIPNTGDESLNEELCEQWKDWSEDAQQCDDQGEWTFWDLERLALRSVFVDGDICALPLESGALQMMEGDRLQRPGNTTLNNVQGVLLDERRRRLQYWFTKDPKQFHIQKVSECNKYPAYDSSGNKLVFHVYNPKRVTQTRGMTHLSAAFDLAGMLEDTNFAKLVQQQVVSLIGVYFERPAGDLSQQGVPAFGAVSAERQPDNSTALTEQMAPGFKLTLPPGYKMQSFSPNVPNAEYFLHCKLILTLMGIQLGLPLVIVTMDASETNFSGWRGAMEQAKQAFKANQRWLIHRFHAEVWKWKVRQWLEAGELGPGSAAFKLGKKLYRHHWQAPGWAYIDPMKDAQADAYRVSNLLASPTQVHHERGGRGHKQIVTEIVTDNSYAIRAAIAESNAIEKDLGIKVGWREVLNWAMPSGFKISGDAADVGDGAEDDAATPGKKTPLPPPSKRQSQSRRGPRAG